MFRSILLASTLIAPLAAQAEDQATWQSNCQNGSCTLVRSVAESGTDRTVATFIVALSKTHETARVGVALPLGTALDAGVRMIVGDKTLNVPFQVCFPDGCRATTEADAATLAALTGAAAVQVQFFPFSSDKPVAIDVPMSGLADAIAAARTTLSQP